MSITSSEPARDPESLERLRSGTDALVCKLLDARRASAGGMLA